jgi:hypothetical protein
MIAKTFGVKAAVKAALVVRPVCQFMQQSCVIASVFGKKEAEALLTRLQLLDGMNGCLRR